MVLQGLSLCGDEDWFRLTLAEDRAMLASIDLGTNDALSLELLGEAGQPAGESSDDSTVVMIEESGSYFLRVTGGTNLYTLRVLVEPTGGPPR